MASVAPPPPLSLAPSAVSQSSPSSTSTWSLFPSSARGPPQPSCASALKTAAHDNTQLYLSLLVPELRALVDQLLMVPTWHFTSTLTAVPLPEPQWQLDEGGFGLAVTRTGERVLVTAQRQRGDESSVRLPEAVR